MQVVVFIQHPAELEHVLSSWAKILQPTSSCFKLSEAKARSSSAAPGMSKHFGMPPTYHRSGIASSSHPKPAPNCGGADLKAYTELGVAKEPPPMNPFHPNKAKQG